MTTLIICIIASGLLGLVLGYVIGASNNDSWNDCD